jgi:hypothetical protein
MQFESHQSDLLPLLVRIMGPFRRALGFGFDTQAFLSDRSYAEIILLQAKESQDHVLQQLATQLAAAMQQSDHLKATGGLNPALSKNTLLPKSEPEDAAEALRAKLLRKYQGGAR